MAAYIETRIVGQSRFFSCSLRTADIAQPTKGENGLVSGVAEAAIYADVLGLTDQVGWREVSDLVT